MKKIFENLVGFALVFTLGFAAGWVHSFIWNLR